MSSIGAVGSSASDLLYALRQQLAARASAGEPDDAPGSCGNAGATAGVSSGDDDQASAASGAGSIQLGKAVLSFVLALQEIGTANDGTQTGSISTEGSGRAQKLFAKLDADGDGAVTQSELTDAIVAKGGDAQKASALFSKLDADGDGSLTETELSAGAPKGHHHARGGASHAGSSGGLDALFETSSSDGGAVTTTDANGTTTITYPDGTKITLEEPGDKAAATGSNSAAEAAGSPGSTQSPTERLLASLIRLQAEMSQADKGPLPLAA
jgi:hypothetical protein